LDETLVGQLATADDFSLIQLAVDLADDFPARLVERPQLRRS
jgi:hypothetical protein